MTKARRLMPSRAKSGDPKSHYRYGHIAHSFELQRIQKGQQIVYYCGHLAADKVDSPNKYEVAAIAVLAVQLFEEGRIDLRQRRAQCMRMVNNKQGLVMCTEYIAIGK